MSNNRNLQDHYFKEAKRNGYRSRAAYKLIEIDEKKTIFKKGYFVLDLGSAPGSWSQVICNINKKVTIHAFDILEMKFKHPQIKFFKKNFLEYNFKSQNEKYDLIISDVAPNTIGHQSTDHLRIISLIESMIDVIESIIQPNGNFICKIWNGSQDKIILSQLKKMFRKISNFKPNSSRNESNEMYIIAQGFLFE